jgi:hypothetical protein
MHCLVQIPWDGKRLLVALSGCQDCEKIDHPKTPKAVKLWRSRLSQEERKAHFAQQVHVVQCMGKFARLCPGVPNRVGWRLAVCVLLLLERRQSRLMTESLSGNLGGGSTSIGLLCR